jgi:DNA-directed RNA polymerase subunit beta'
LETTVGQLLVNESLPEDLRDYERVLDKKSIAALLQQVAEKYPDRYREVAKNLSDAGRDAAYTTGGHSFGLEDLRQSVAGRRMRTQLNAKLKGIYASNIPDEKKEAQIVELVGEYQTRLADEVLDEAVATGNPLARQLVGAGRGNKFQLNSLLGADLLYTDHKGDIVPVPVLRSQSSF